MTDQTAYVKSLAEAGSLPTGSAIIRDLLDNLDEGLSGSTIRTPGRISGEVFVSTYEQVYEYLEDFAAAYEEHERENAGGD